MGLGNLPCEKRARYAGATIFIGKNGTTCIGGEQVGIESLPSGSSSPDGI